MRNKPNSKIHAFLYAIAITAVTIAIAAAFVQISWNMVVPELFGATKMNFKNAFGVVVLTSTVTMIVSQCRKRYRTHLTTSTTTQNETK